MATFQEHQIISQLKVVFHGTEKLLQALPGPTDPGEVEKLRHEVDTLRATLYCPICGTDRLAFPEHTSKCPNCGGLLHWSLDSGRCEDCDYAAALNIEDNLLESVSE